MEKPTDLLTVAEVARLKDVSEDAVRKRINRKKLPAIKKFNAVLIRRRDLDGWEVQRKRKVEDA